MAKKTKKTGAEATRGSIDYPYLIIVLLLLGIGLLMVFSSSYASAYYKNLPSTYYFLRQGMFAVGGVIIMFLIGGMDYRRFRVLSPILMIASILLLILVLFIGVGLYGEKRWINLGFTTFQPSELAKFTMILMFGRLTRKFGDRAEKFRYGVLGFGAAMLGILVPLALEKHLSAIMLMGMVGVVMMFVAGTRVRWLLAGAGAAAVFVVIYVSLMGYAGDRITAWLHPERDPGDTGYQILQSLYAIGSGGVFGLGFGKSRQKYLYLPFQYNDYIFAVICEELGLVGASAVMLLLAALILRGYWVALHAQDRFSTVLAAGLITLIAVQTVLNLGVVTNLLPSTGIALPFFSYGGTALAVNLGEMGIVLSISRHCGERKILEA